MVSGFLGLSDLSDLVRLMVYFFSMLIVGRYRFLNESKLMLYWIEMDDNNSEISCSIIWFIIEVCSDMSSEELRSILKKKKIKYKRTNKV